MLWTTSLKTEGPNYKKKVNSLSLVFRNLSTVVRTRGRSVDLTQPMKTIGSSSTYAHGYEFDSLKLKPEFTCTRLSKIYIYFLH